MGFLEKYKFTNKRHPVKSIMGVNLALISICTQAAVISSASRSGAKVPLSHAAAGVLAIIMAAVGMGLCIAARLEHDRYYLFPNIGIVLNLAAFLAGGGIFIMGVR